MEDGPFSVLEEGVRRSSFLSRPETQEGWTTVTPPPYEEPSWSGVGQEDASKLSHSLTFLQLLVQQPADIKAFMPL